MHTRLGASKWWQRSQLSPNVYFCFFWWRCLQEICETYGTVVKVNLLWDTVIDLSRCEAFVEYDQTDDAEKAKRFLDGAWIDGRVAVVAFSSLDRSAQKDLARHKDESSRRSLKPRRLSPPRRGRTPPRRRYSPPRRGRSPPRRGRTPPRSYRGRSRSPPRRRDKKRRSYSYSYSYSPSRSRSRSRRR